MLSEEQTHDETRHVHIIDGVEYVMGTPEYAAALAEWQERTAEMFAEDKARWEATRPLSAEEAIAAVVSAMPSITIAIADIVAVRMLPYLPERDELAVTTVGTLAKHEGKVYRKALTGWVEVPGQTT